jgi:hypothetical protein
MSDVSPFKNVVLYIAAKGKMLWPRKLNFRNAVGLRA